MEFYLRKYNKNETTRGVINEEGILIRRLSEKIFIIDLVITSPSTGDTII